MKSWFDDPSDTCLLNILPLFGCAADHFRCQKEAVKVKKRLVEVGSRQHHRHHRQQVSILVVILTLTLVKHLILSLNSSEFFDKEPILSLKKVAF